MQGLDQQGFDPDELLQQQHAWEKKQKDKAGEDKPAGKPASQSMPAPATSTDKPA